MQNLPQQNQPTYPQFTQPPNYRQSQPIYNGHLQPINGQFQPRFDQPQPGHGRPQSLYPHMQYQPNTQSPYVLGPNQQLDFFKLDKIKELEKRLDKGWYVCFKVVLCLMFFGSFLQIFSVFGNSYWFSVGSGLIIFTASNLALSAMRNKRTQEAKQALGLFLFEIIFIGVNLAEFFRVTKGNRNFNVIFPMTCIVTITFHLFVVVLGTYKVRKVLKERDQLKNDLEMPLNQNVA